MYPFESIQQTKGNTPTQGFIGPPLVDMAKYVAICRKIVVPDMFINLAIPPPRGGFKY